MYKKIIKRKSFRSFGSYFYPYPAGKTSSSYWINLSKFLINILDIFDEKFK